MKDPSKTKQKLIKELSVLKQKIDKLEKSETKHKQAEEALSQSEEKYRTILENIQEGYFELDLAGNYTFANEANCRYLGYTKEELVGMNFRQHTDEETAKKFRQPFQELYRTGKPINTLEAETIRKDGTKAIYETSVSLIRNNEGKPIGFRGVSRDVTKRKNMEEALRQSEERYRTIIENIEDGYFEVDLTGTLTFVNDAQCRNVGTPREQLLGMNNRDYTSEEEAKKLYQLFIGIYRTGEPVKGFAFKYKKRDGTMAFVEMSVSLIRDIAGKPIGFRGISRDITERKRAESQREAALEALRVSEEKYRLVVENAKEAIIIAQDLKLVFVNRAAVDMIGYSGEILVSKSFTDFIHPDDRNMVVDYHIRRLKGESVPFAYSFRIISQDGTVKWVEFNTAVIQWKEKPATLSFLNDITERRQTEEKLRQSEEYFKEITENSSDVIIITDKNGDVKYCSRSIERFSGYKPEELIGKSGFMFIHPDDVERAADDFGKAMLAVDTAIPNEFRLVLKDGSSRYFDGLGKNLLDNPAVAGFIMNVRDITERKQAESQREAALEKLRQSEERYRNILESIQEGYFELDLDGNYTFTNETNCRFLGYAKEELIGMNYRRHTDEETAKRLYQLYYELYRTGKPIELLDLESIRKDGTKAIYETSASLIRNSEGKPIGFRGVSRDVTERKNMEEALRQSEEKFRKAFYTSPDSMAISRLEDGMYISINPGFTRGTKYTEKDIIGKTSIEFNIWDNVEDRQRLVAKLKKDGAVINLESTFRRKSGEIRYGLVSASVIDLNGVPHLLSITRDITERKRVEEEKRKLEERLQSAHKMEAIGTLAGGIAHDFNNLLMGIQGYASLVLLNISQNDPNYEKLKRIEQQVQSGADLTRQLLGFARGGRYEVKPADINDLLQKTSSMFGRTKKEITIQMKCEKDLCPVEVDIGQMEQVFMNLYVNAWQAMPGGGYIYLETENIFLIDEQALLYSVKPGKYVKITVTDTGIGMDEKTRERIFDPFFTTKAMGRGTGLGLATVYGIIKGHKGMINAYSELGHGTTFTIYLPASQKEVVKKETATGTIERGTETILLVDDEKIVLEVSREMLESVGYRVYAVGSGQEAITLFTEKRNEIDLVILDMIMPGISGGETFDRLREINPGIKVLLSSGYSLNGEAQTIMDRGCKGFIQKPFQIENISQKVREMLD